MSVSVDLTRPPTAREQVRMAGRLQRLRRPELCIELERLGGLIPPPTGAAPLAIRTNFSYRADRLDEEASDRRVPRPEFRPPATRLLTSRGSALRFAVTLLALTQAHRRPGQRARLADLGLPIVGDSRQRGWADLVVTNADDYTDGKVAIRAREKRARSVRNALKALRAAGLVEIPAGEDRWSRFTLLNERGTDVVREREEYRVPKREPTFNVPDGFVSNGWLHVLEDSEIALLLMIACGVGGQREGRHLFMPSGARLLHYGIHRDAFSSARKTLEWFGLLDVEEHNRHEDGRAENGELRVHRLALLEDGFGRAAVPALIEVIEKQLARV